MEEVLHLFMSGSRYKALMIVGAIVILVVGIYLFLNRNEGKEGSQNSEVQLQENEADEVEGKDEERPAVQSPEPLNETTIPSLAATYANDFPIGAAVEPYLIDGIHGELLKKHFNWLVAENAMKPDSLQPSEGNFTWERVDQIVTFAKENQMELRFHTLVWHNQTPDWFFLDAEGKPMAEETELVRREANKKLLLERLESHIGTIVGRYKNDIQSWDVVNEVVELGDPDGMRASNWYKITGTDYIETAFRAAREAGGPDIMLYINDYGTEDPAKRDRIYELVSEMLDKGVPIDGVGHQSHMNLQWPSVDSIILSMRKFSELGLDNLVTELDMSIYAWEDRSDYGTEIPEKVLHQQAERYRQLFEAFRTNKDLLSGVVFWGIADNHTWLNSFPVNRTDAPLLFDQRLQPKEAFWAVTGSSEKP